MRERSRASHGVASLGYNYKYKRTLKKDNKNNQEEIRS